MKTYKLGNVLAKVKRPGKLKATEYQAEGDFPVIDQGEGQIAGYTDIADIVLTEPLPIVVFGDHTRRVKLAREPFVCGADGTQLLYPSTRDLDPHFFYYAVKNIDLSNYFYARHFKFLKDQEFQAPELPAQRRIVETLSAYDDLIENNRRRIALLEDAARQLHKEWFVRFRFPGHEHVKVVDGVPEGWEPKQLADCVDVVKDAADPKALEPDTPYIGLEHLPRRSITLGEWETAKKVESGKFRFRERDIIFGKIRPYFHKVGFALTEGITSSDAIVMRAKDEDLWAAILLEVSSDRFVALASQTVKEGSKMPRANWDVLKKHVLAIPPDGLREIFSDPIDSITSQTKALSLAISNAAKARDLLLPKLMNGTLTV